MNRKYHVELSEEERAEIQEKLMDEKLPKGIRKRCHVLLEADEKAGSRATHEELVVRCGVSDVTVYTVIKEYATQGMDYCLRRQHREVAPNPPIVSGEKEARIVALACGVAPEGRSRWALRFLTAKVVELKIVEKISHTTIHTILKKHNLNLI